MDIIIILILVLPFIPVKICVNIIPGKSDSEFCFIRHNGIKGWLLADNENGLLDWDILYPVHHGTAFDFLKRRSIYTIMIGLKNKLQS